MNNENKTNINWYPGHMEKAKREIRERLSLIDVVFEVVDARIPMSSRIIDLDELIKNKPRIMIMSKYDLCDKKETDKFVKYYEANGYVVIPACLKDNKIKKQIINKTNELMQEINQERAKKGMKPRNARVMVIGVPNAGKSTLINMLVGKKAAVVGDKPGVTRSIGWIRVGNNIELLDTPGILWPKLVDQDGAYKLAMTSAIREEILNKKDIAYYILNTLKEKYPENLKERYNIEIQDELEIMMEDIAKSRKCLKEGNILDLERVYGIIISDAANNRLGNITLDTI